MLCLVAEEVHRKEGRRAAAEDGKQQQRRLGNTPQLFVSMAVADGLVLVDAIGNKGQQVDRQKII